MIKITYRIDGITFKSVGEILKYKKEHPSWQGVQFLDEKPITTKL